MKLSFLGVIALLSTCVSMQGQTPVFIPEGWLYNANYTGTAQGTTLNGGTTMVPSDPATSFQIQNKVASPQGGDYITGHYQGTQNFNNYFLLTRFNVDNFVDSSGTGVMLSNGQSYNGVFWMRGNEVADVLAGGNYGFTYDTNVVVTIYDSAGINVIDTYATTVPFSNNSWTEVNIPFTYDSATMPGALLGLQFARGSNDWDYTNNQLVPSVLQSNRLGTTSFDFVQAVPEPSLSIILGSCLLGGLLVRRRQRS